jgi:hypothetical protein
MANMVRAKIQLSQEELVLVQNAEWLLTKNRIIGKVYEMFGYLIDDVQTLLAGNAIMSTDIFTVSPKISKGENYLGLPYVMLDYPRCFGKTDVFAVRTMFWWGHFFSTTLHLKGKYKQQLVRALKNNLPLLSAHHFFISVHEDEWRHDFDPGNYTAIRSNEPAMFADNIEKKDFCKIAAKISLHDWNNISGQLLTHYKIIFEQLISNFPGDERDL